MCQYVLEINSVSNWCDERQNIYLLKDTGNNIASSRSNFYYARVWECGLFMTLNQLLKLHADKRDLLGWLGIGVIQRYRISEPLSYMMNQTFLFHT
jgi:hypothetical protein